jgi:hypothetical protein
MIAACRERNIGAIGKEVESVKGENLGEKSSAIQCCENWARVEIVGKKG